MNARRRGIAVALAAAALLFAVLPGSPAHAATSRGLDVVSVDTSNPPQIRITVSVPRELVGHRLNGSDFTVIQDGRRRLPTITRLPADALAVVLAVDSSGSMAGPAIAAAKAAATQFVQQMPAGAQAAVVGFGDSPYVVTPFTHDVGALAAGIAGMQAGGDTALYDGVARAAQLLAGTGAGARRVVVLLSDGGDTKSIATLTGAATALADANASFYAAALLTSETDLPALNQLAQSAGGRVTSATDPAALSGLYADIETRITNQYQLAFPAIGHGATDIRVGVDADGIQANSEFTLDLTSPQRVSPVEVHPVQITSTSAPLLGGRTWALAIGGALVFLALVVSLLTVLRPRPRESTIALERRRRRSRRRDQALGDLVESASRVAERTLERRGKRRTLYDALERAGIDMRPGEFSVLVAAVTFAALLLGLVLFGPVVGLALGVVPVFVFRGAVAARAERRRNQFADQLGDTLHLMTSSLRSGHGLMQAIDAVAEESDSPTREEFRRIIVETRLGKPMHDALHDAVDRVRNDDFAWVVQAIDIHREVGGDLAEVLDHVAGTIRSRNSVRRQVRTLSAEGRLSAVILTILPLAMVGIIEVVNPKYLNDLWSSTAGNVMVAVGGALLVTGSLWMRRIIRLVF